MTGEALADIAFEARVIEWRGPSPFYFQPIPDSHVGEIRWAAQQASYGWGVVPVAAELAGIAFQTSLFPKDGGYLVPFKDAVRKPAGIAPGDVVRIRLRITAQGSIPAG